MPRSGQAIGKRRHSYERCDDPAEHRWTHAGDHIGMYALATGTATRYQPIFRGIWRSDRRASYRIFEFGRNRELGRLLRIYGFVERGVFFVTESVGIERGPLVDRISRSISYTGCRLGGDGHILERTAHIG